MNLTWLEVHSESLCLQEILHKTLWKLIYACVAEGKAWEPLNSKASTLNGPSFVLVHEFLMIVIMWYYLVLLTLVIISELIGDIINVMQRFQMLSFYLEGIFKIPLPSYLMKFQEPVRHIS